MAIFNTSAEYNPKDLAFEFQITKSYVSDFIIHTENLENVYVPLVILDLLCKITSGSCN